MKHNIVIILFSGTLAVCTVSHAIAIPTTIGQYDQLVQNVLGADPLVAAEAMATILNDDQAVLATAEPILSAINDAPVDITSDPLFDQSRLPLWVLIITLNRELPRGNRTYTVCEWFSHGIREMSPSDEKEKVRTTILNLYMHNYERTKDVNYLSFAEKLFFWPMDIIPESGCELLMSFFNKVVEEKIDNEKISAEEEIILFDILVKYALLKVTPDKQEQWLAKYTSFIDKTKLEPAVERMIYRNYYFHPAKENKYRDLYGKTPEQLVELISNGYMFDSTSDWCIGRLLAGNWELRQQNFQLLLPLVRTGCIGKCLSYLGLFCEPIPTDASEELQSQQKIVLDILEERIVNENSPFVVRTLDKMMPWDTTEKFCDRYAVIRIQEILVKGMNSSNSEISRESTSLLARILSRCINPKE